MNYLTLQFNTLKNAIEKLQNNQYFILSEIFTNTFEFQNTYVLI